jgi:hypothetical protein
MCIWSGQYCQGRKGNRERLNPTGSKLGDYQPKVEAWRVESEGESPLQDGKIDAT